MTPAYLRALQSAIQASDECAALAVTPDMGKVQGAYERDRAIADILNASGWGATSAAVESWKAKKLLIKRGKWLGIVRAADNDAHPAQAAAFAAVELANDARMTADFQDADAAPLMAGLKAAGLLSDSDVDALRAMCIVPSNVTADHVSRALRGPWGDEE